VGHPIICIHQKAKAKAKAKAKTKAKAKAKAKTEAGPSTPLKYASLRMTAH